MGQARRAVAVLILVAATRCCQAVRARPLGFIGRGHVFRALGYCPLRLSRAVDVAATYMNFTEGPSSQQRMRLDFPVAEPQRRPSHPEAESAQDLWQNSAPYGEIVDVTSFKEVDIQLSTAFTPLERIAIAADGNLQRIVSSYYNAPVGVTIKRCVELESGLFDREVDLSVFGKVFCTATSSLKPKTLDCAELLREKKLGLGQLFRYLGTYPSFRLLDAGKDHQEFWRLYELDCSSVTCRILERFAHDTFSRSAPAAGEGR